MPALTFDDLVEQAPSGGGVRTIPAQDGRPARVIMDMSSGPQQSTGPLTFDDLMPESGLDKAGRYAEDFVRSTVSGLDKGVTGLVGLPADISRGIVSAGNYLQSAYEGRPYDEVSAEFDKSFPSVRPTLEKFGGHALHEASPLAYTPQTGAGKTAENVASFLPGGAIGRLANVGRNVAAFGLVPGIVSEGAGRLFEGTSAEGPARFAGALAGGLGSAGAMRMGSAERLVQRSTNGVTAAELDAAEQLFQRAQQAGQPISRAEAVQAVTQGRTGIGDLQHTVEGMGGMRDFYAARPAQNEAAARQAFEGITPQAAYPSQLGPAIGGSAERIVTDVRQAINRATRPMYDAAGQHLVPRQVHDAMMADPLFAQTVDMIRRDPALNANVRAASDRSVRMYDEVAKQLETRAQNAAQPLNPNANQSVAATTGSLGADVKDIAIASDRAAVNGPSSYEAALANQTRLRQQYLEPLLNGPIGKIAGRDTKTKDAINALFPANPLPNSAVEIGQAVGALSARNPMVARQLVRTHAEMTFNEAAQRLVGGPNQSGGAKFAAILRGNPQQAANLEAAVRALPNGNQIWPGFNRFLEILEAQQFRQATGSRTAFKIPGVEDLKGGGLLNNAMQTVATGGFKWPQKAIQAIQNWNVGRNLDELARLLTDPAAANYFRSIATAPSRGQKALALTARLATIANNSSRIESRATSR